MPSLEKDTQLKRTTARLAEVANVVGSGAKDLADDAVDVVGNVTTGVGHATDTIENVRAALNSKGGGGRKRYIKSPKGRRLVRKGPRGGKYIIYNGKKRYLTKK